jgi:hypothetical protein
VPDRNAEIVARFRITVPVAGTVIALPAEISTVPPKPAGAIVVAVEPSIVTTTGEPVVLYSSRMPEDTGSTSDADRTLRVAVTGPLEPVKVVATRVAIYYFLLKLHCNVF